MNSEHSTRVALLHGRNYHKKVLQLIKGIANETLVFSSEGVDDSLREAVAGCDLIVIEAQHHLTPYQRQAIQWVRTGSMAPIVVLIGEKHTEDTVDIIKTGADAVIPLYLTTDAIMAHCQALMRRWRSNPYSSPKFA
jgi:DNA-binding response OmpR family regulator